MESETPEWNPAIIILTNPPGNPGANSGVRTTGVSCLLWSSPFQVQEREKENKGDLLLLLLLSGACMEKGETINK